MPRVFAIAAAIILTLGLAGPVAATGPGSSGEHAPVYYLALGDSLAAGVQPTGDPAQMYRTSEGYVDQLYAAAKAWYPNLQLVNLACPGESTTTMIHGGICAYDRGSQLAEAINFLHAHGKFVAFVTIDLGSNDFVCQNDVSCLPPGFVTIGQNLPGILSQLRAAAGPDMPIFGMTIYDPFLGWWLTGEAGQALAVQSVWQGIVPLNGLLTLIFGEAGIQVADVQGAFSTTDFTPVPALGDLPLNVALICQWTWVCAPSPLGPNNHPNATGYGVIAQAFAAIVHP